MLSKQSSKINEASVVFVGSNDKVRFLDDSTRLESDDSMASLEEGQEATESEQGMTTFGPYVRDKNRSAALFSREVNEREQGVQRQLQQQQQQQQQQAHPGPRQRTAGSASVKAREQEATGAKGFFKMIRSSISSAAGLPGRDSPSSVGGGGAMRRVGQNQQRERGQPVRVGPRQPAKGIPHPASAPVLNKPPTVANGRHKVQSPVSRTAHHQPRRNIRTASRETSPSSGPLVIKDMASYGPGAGRSVHRSSVPTTSREQISPPRHEVRSKSEEPSPMEEGEFDDDRGRGFSHTVHSPIDDTDITLVSYSDVHRHKAAKMRKANSAASALGGARGEAWSKTSGLLPLGMKQQLNKQDVLKRIGSIENDEVHTMYMHV